MIRSTNIEESLEVFVECHNHPITDVLDVGVQWGTSFLMRSFPKAKHWLVEPVSQYHGKIKAEYSSYDYELVPLALSDEQGLLYLHEYDYDRSGRITHSHLYKEKKQSPHLLNISEVKVSTLDEVFTSKAFPDHQYIVKIDVDGLEGQIIRGGEEVLRKAALVIVEAPLRYLHQRLGLMESLSFTLWDICDPAYYYSQLHQVDLVLINNAVKDENLEFRPWSKNGGTLVREKWQGSYMLRREK